MGRFAPSFFRGARLMRLTRKFVVAVVLGIMVVLSVSVPVPPDATATLRRSFQVRGMDYALKAA